MEINTINYSYFDSLIAKINNEDLNELEQIELLKEIVMIQSASIDGLERRLNNLLDMLKTFDKLDGYEEY